MVFIVHNLSSVYDSLHFTVGSEIRNRRTDGGRTDEFQQGENLIIFQSIHLHLAENLLSTIFEAFPPTILTLGAGGRFDSHFWTQSGAPSPYLAFRAPPRFQAIYGVESVPRFQPIFGTQSAPPPAFKLYMVLKACPPRFQPIFGTQSAPPLSSSIWC